MAEDDSSLIKYREYLVQPKGARREAVILFGIICLVVLLMSIRFSMVSSVKSSNVLKSYQIRSVNLKAQAPILYRTLIGVVADIEDFHEETNSWPAVEVLEEEGLPPFASVFLPVGLRGFSWALYVGEGFVDYYGRNMAIAEDKKNGGDPLEKTFILRIVDLQAPNHPHPHQGKDNNKQKRFNSQVWINSGNAEYPAASLSEKGWKWIVSSNLSESDVVVELEGQ